MARWEPDTRGRLLRSAIDLFSEVGYDATTAAEIAERAGLTKTTLFRHFTDKREILFQGQEVLVELVVSGVASAPDGSSAVEVLRAGVLAPCGLHDRNGRDLGRRVDAIVADSPELQERALTKRAGIGHALQSALTARLGDARRAGVLADVGMRAYYEGFAAWVAADDERTLVDIAGAELDAYVAALAPTG